MKTYSFFSFKGGVGRTALMVNIGAYWANRGETVLMIDMDLSAPGMSYSPLLGDYLHAKDQGKGFSDLLAAFYQGRNKNPNQLHFMPPHLLMREVYPPDKNGIPLRERRWERGGRLLAIGAGTAPIPQQEKSQKTSPQNASSHADGPKSLTIIKDIPPEDGRGEEETLEEFSLRALAFAIKDDLNTWRENDRPIDRVLIDCRTGLPELLELSLGYLSSRMVMVAGLNEQNREGMHQLLAALQKRISIGEFPGVLRVVFSPVPRTDDEDNVVAALAENKKLLKSLMRTDPRNDEQESPPTISLLHYTPRLATGDVPLVTTHPHLLYAQEVREIAKWLEGDFRTASVIEGFKDRLDETGNFLKHEGLTGLMGSATTLRSHPSVGLPRWFWPLPREIRKHPERLTQKCNELITFHPDINVDKDAFLTKLSWSVSLNASEKQQIIRKAESQSQEQIDQLLNIFDEERQKFASLEEARWETLLAIYWHHQKDWAEVVAGPEGVKQFLTAPFTGEILHPSWEMWPIYWAKIAHALSKQDPAQAERAYQRAIAADPNHASSLGDFATFMTYIRKDHDQAEQLHQRTIAADPNHAGSLGNFANFMTHIRQNHDQAEQLYRRAIAADPSHANNLGNFASFLLARKRREEGLERLRAAFNLSPLEHLLHLELLYYATTHAPDLYPEALATLKRLILDGVRSPEWDLSGHVAIAREQNDPRTELLAQLAAVISNEADPAVLDRFPLWREIHP